MSQVDSLLPDSLAEGAPLLSTGGLGERRTRAYVADSARFYVVCERLEPGGPMKCRGYTFPDSAECGVRSAESVRRAKSEVRSAKSEVRDRD